MEERGYSTRQAAPSARGKPASAASIVLIACCAAALTGGVIYLFRTNPATGKWAQNYDPAGRWWLSTLLAALPVIVLLGAMAILRLKAHVAAVRSGIRALSHLLDYFAGHLSLSTHCEDGPLS
jgi:lactate permease